LLATSHGTKIDCTPLLLFTPLLFINVDWRSCLTLSSIYIFKLKIILDKSKTANK
jgi:hypothetical protein